MKKKVAFVYLDDIHMVYHFIGIVAEMNKLSDKYELEILTYKDEHKELFKLCDILDIDRKCVKQLNTRLYRRVKESIVKRRFPNPMYMFKKHKNLLLSYDVLIFTDVKHGQIYDQRKSGIPKFIYIGHGAGNGVYPFELEVITKFDLILVPSEKVLGLHKKYFDYPNTTFNIIGYPKLDIAKIEDKHKKLFDNENPTILYNPHFKHDLSSWYKEGLKVLEFFYNNKDYNLIFAPHINLFNRKKNAYIADLNPEYFQANNMLIDLGSINSTNMTYTMRSDLYLGDVSSQVYEFLLYKIRPCIFIVPEDANETSPNFGQVFSIGKTISDIENLKELLDKKDEWHKEYIAPQEKLVKDTFDIHLDIDSSKRAVNAIDEFLDK